MLSLFAVSSQKANADTVNDTTSKATLSTAPHTVVNNKITVVSGDTLFWISKNHNTTVDTLMRVNNLSSTIIFPGQVLTLSGSNQTQNTTSQSTQSSASSQAAQSSNTQSTQSSASAQATPAKTQTAPAATQRISTTATSTTTSTSSDDSAKAWISNHESGGSYTARNGQYYGKYQLSASSLNGDYSAANQERVANQYVSSRYGSWSQAKQHWINNGWY